MQNTTWKSPTWNMDKDLSKEIEESEKLLSKCPLILKDNRFDKHYEKLYKYFERSALNKNGSI